MEKPPDHTLLLKFFDGEADDHEVPAGTLGQVLIGLQRAFHLVGMIEVGATVKSRAKPNREVRELYKVSCRPLREGSLEALLKLGGDTTGLFDGSYLTDGIRRLWDGMGAVRDGDAQRLARAIPDRLSRQGFLRAFETMAPEKESRVRFAIFPGAQETVSPALVSDGLSKTVTKLREESQNEAETQTLAGFLHAIRFEDSTIELRYPPTNQLLRCTYQPEVEEMLLSHPRDLIRVTGIVIVDDQGRPERIVDVHDIQELDLSPLSLDRFASGGKVIPFLDTLELSIGHDEHYQSLRVKCEDLDIDLEATTREELMESLLIELDVIWHNYAKAPDDRLTPGAQALKRALLSKVGRD
jgi:hypothetical protein